MNYIVASLEPITSSADRAFAPHLKALAPVALPFHFAPAMIPIDDPR